MQKWPKCETGRNRSVLFSDLKASLSKHSLVSKFKGRGKSFLEHFRSDRVTQSEVQDDFSLFSRLHYIKPFICASANMFTLFPAVISVRTRWCDDLQLCFANTRYLACVSERTVGAFRSSLSWRLSSFLGEEFQHVPHVYQSISFSAHLFFPLLLWCRNLLFSLPCKWRASHPCGSVTVPRVSAVSPIQTF